MIDGTTASAGFRAQAELRDGTPVCLRAIRRDDKELLRIAFGRLSGRTVYRRFFHPVTALTAEDLRYLTELDFHDHVALAVTIAGEDGETLIALGRFVRVSSAPDRAELAFTVADDYQHRGAATLLLRQLVALARHHGIAEFVANMLDDNKEMLEVFRSSGLPMQQTFEDGVRRVVLRLAAEEQKLGATNG